jgi:hypothetical protein
MGKVTDHVATDGSLNVAITADAHDVPGLRAMLDSPGPDVAANMERHGVIPPIATFNEK